MSTSTQQAAVTLASTRNFAGLGVESFTALLEVCPIKRFAAGAPLFERGDEAGCGYILISGRVELVDTPYPGRRLSSQLFSAGELFGDSGFVYPWTFKRQCTALEDTDVVMLSPAALAERLEQRDPVAMRLIDTLLDEFVHNLRDANKRLDEIFSRPDRTLRLLLEMKAAEV